MPAGPTSSVWATIGAPTRRRSVHGSDTLAGSTRAAGESFIGVFDSFRHGRYAGRPAGRLDSTHGPSDQSAPGREEPTRAAAVCPRGPTQGEGGEGPAAARRAAAPTTVGDG